MRASDRGRFVLRARGDGFYSLDVRAIGFKPHTSPWIALASSDTVEATVRVTRSSVVLSRVVIKAQRDSLLETSFLGMKLETMAARLVTPAEVLERRGSARRIDHVVILDAIEAGVLFGGNADAGVVLIFTKGYAGGTR